MCLIQNWISASSWLVSFEKKTKPKQNHRRQKTPSQHNFLPSDEKVTMVTGEKDQMLPFWGRAAHISSKPACSGGEGCQETLHSESPARCRPPVAKAAAQGEPWSSARGLAAPGRRHLRAPALLTRSSDSPFDLASPGLWQHRCWIWGDL